MICNLIKRSYSQMTSKLQTLRNLMKESNYNAYIVPSNDDHDTEYVCEADKRLQFISEFKGENGVGLITETEALCWTDSRFYLQAQKELPKEWKMMKMSPGEPTLSTWIVENMPPKSIVGLDGSLFNFKVFKTLQSKLKSHDIEINYEGDNLIDKIWSDRPKYPSDEAIIHPIQYCGKTYKEKIAEVRKMMKSNNSNYLILSALHSVCWLYNLRGNDIEYNPLLISYAVISEDESIIFINPEKVKDETTKKYLNNNNIIVKPYETIFHYIDNLLKINPTKKVWIDPSTCNIKLLSKHYLSNPDRFIEKIDPATILCSRKNEVEIKGMKECHIRDAVAMCESLYWLENTIKNVNYKDGDLDELKISEIFNNNRYKQKLNKGLSFPSIIGSGPNGSIVHYIPTKESNRKVLKDDVILIDTGGQYLDGTTDITRTVCYSDNISNEVKEMFTRVMKGHISVCSKSCPVGNSGTCYDTFAREYLWEIGKDFGHGVGHGVGSFLSVHEGPQGIGPRANGNYSDGFLPGMTITDEPGYYKDNEYGIRIENTEIVVDCGNGFIKMEPLSCVPFESDLIDVKLLNDSEKKWLIEYNKMCYDKVGNYVSDEVKEWLKKQYIDMEELLK